MPNAGKTRPLIGIIQLIPVLAVITCGMYTAVYGETLDVKWSAILGLVVLSGGAYLWVMTIFYQTVRDDLAETSEALDDMAQKEHLLEVRVSDLQRQLELLAAQREVSRVASSEVGSEQSQNLLFEILRVVSNLVHVEEGVDVTEIILFLPEENTGRLVPGAARHGDDVSFGEDIHISALDMSLVNDAEEHNTPVSTVEKNTVSFAFPLLSDQDLVGVLFAEVMLQAEGNEMSEKIGVLQSSLQEISQQVSIPLTRHVFKTTSVTDGLTKLHNKSYFLERLGEYFAMSRRDNFCLSLMMIDIDHFKKINDQYGHQAGDAILAQTAEFITNTVRGYDLAYTGFRYGGEEMSVILPDTNENDASKIARRLRKMVDEKHWDLHDGKRIKMTISIGVAEAGGDIKNKEELISRADSALYRAKNTGRNRVCIWKKE